MDFYEFMRQVCQQVQEKAGEQYLITVENMGIGNEEGNYALCARDRRSGGRSVRYLHMEKVYTDYQSGKPMEPYIEGFLHGIGIAKRYWEGRDKEKEETRWEKIKEYVYPVVVWSEKNQKLLSLLPHREFLDLSVYYMIRREDCIQGGIAVKITRNLQERLQVTEEELYQQATENLKKDQYQMKTLKETIQENFDEESIQALEIEDNLLVLTNRIMWCGAAGILLGKNFFQEVLGKKDYYVVPSSIHELLFVPADDLWGLDKVNAILQGIEQEQAIADERLNDHFYYYNGSTGEIELP